MNHRQQSWKISIAVLLLLQETELPVMLVTVAVGSNPPESLGPARLPAWLAASLTSWWEAMGGSLVPLFWLVMQGAQLDLETITVCLNLEGKSERLAWL